MLLYVLCEKLPNPLRLRRKNKAMLKKLARAELEPKAMEKQRDDLSAQVDELYEEINELKGDSEFE